MSEWVIKDDIARRNLELTRFAVYLIHDRGGWYCKAPDMAMQADAAARRR